jgi:CheY-like chemotaxis protein
VKTTRVLLADDHVLVRAGIRSLLEKMTGIEVVAEAGDGREALELIKKQLPNVVLMDIAIPELNGLEALARATKEFSAVKGDHSFDARQRGVRAAGFGRGRAATFSRMRRWPNWSWPSGP